MYALNMMDIAIEIATSDDSFEDSATKFYEHFIMIAEALNELGLWNEDDKFFYDVLSLNDQPPFALKVRSIVGLAPLFAVSIIKKEQLDKLPDFEKRMNWFRNYRIKNNKYLANKQSNNEASILFSLLDEEKLKQLLEKLLDEEEFLSQGGVRALSKYYEKNPYHVSIEGVDFGIHYDPGDSTSNLFGGNSNWRGPVWMPINYLIIKAIDKYGAFYGDTLKVECPRGSGKYMNLTEVAAELANRIVHIFQKDENNNRLLYGDYSWFYKQPENEDLLLFHEYFHGDTSRGLGASHQTGWTAAIVNLIRRI